VLFRSFRGNLWTLDPPVVVDAQLLSERARRAVGTIA